jgi:hypothetical protein
MIDRPMPFKSFLVRDRQLQFFVNASGGRPLGLFESGAILQYLAEKTGKLVPTDANEKFEEIEHLRLDSNKTSAAAQLAPVSIKDEIVEITLSARSRPKCFPSNQGDRNVP